MRRLAKRWAISTCYMHNKEKARACTATQVLVPVSGVPRMRTIPSGQHFTLRTKSTPPQCGAACI
jgi:hypothetical protein